MGWREAAESVFDGFTLDLDGEDTDKRGFMVVGDGWCGWPMRLERWVWTEFEIFSKVWKRACNGFSDILDRAGKKAEDGRFGSWR